jgi:hypothetical protein
MGEQDQPQNESNSIPVKVKNPGHRFQKGNKYGKGNPHAKMLKTHRDALMECWTPENTRKVFAKLLEAALAGKQWAIEEYNNRLLGRAVQPFIGEVNSNITTQIISTLLVDDSEERRKAVVAMLEARQLSQNPPRIIETTATVPEAPKLLEAPRDEQQLNMPNRVDSAEVQPEPPEQSK